MTEPVRPTMVADEVLSLLARNIDEDTVRDFASEVLLVGSAYLRMDSDGKVTHIPLQAISVRLPYQE